jgi:hypothetical protein
VEEVEEGEMTFLDEEVRFKPKGKVERFEEEIVERPVVMDRRVVEKEEYRRPVLEEEEYRRPIVEEEEYKRPIVEEPTVKKVEEIVVEPVVK